MMQSAMALVMGMLEAPFTSSAPFSRRNHFALPFRPHSLSSVNSSTSGPFGSWSLPWRFCTVFCRGVCGLPAHLDEVHPGD